MQFNQMCIKWQHPCQSACQPTITHQAFQPRAPVASDAQLREGAQGSDRIIALDFDQTLAQNFLFGELGDSKSPEVKERNLHLWAKDGRLLQAFGGEGRVADIRAALRERKNQGDLVVVLSSGLAQVIRPALKYMGIDDLIPSELVYGSDTPLWGIGKRSRLERLKKIHNRTKATLVDDDVGHCRECLKGGNDVIWVRNQRGMQEHELGMLSRGEWHGDMDLRFNNNASIEQNAAPHTLLANFVVETTISCPTKTAEPSRAVNMTKYTRDDTSSICQEQYSTLLPGKLLLEQDTSPGWNVFSFWRKMFLC